MTLGIGLVLISSVLLFIIYTKKSDSISYGIIYTFLHVYVSITFLANILSVFGTFTKPWLITFWIVTAVALTVICVVNKIKPDSVCKKLATIKNYSLIEKIIIWIIIISFFMCLYRALIYPPTNTDSLVYHLPRAFYYYKMGEVTNIPSNYIVMNYTPPASEIILSHTFIICDGSDRLVNLLQLPIFVIIAVATRLIALKCGCSRRMSLVMTLIATSLPLVILQSVTTQNDLMAAGFVLLFVLFSLKPLGLEVNRRTIKIHESILMGICAGMAVYTKITAAIVMLPLAIIMLSVTACRRDRRGIIYLFAGTIPAALINLPYWVRNVIDLNGDFLALKTSSYMSGKAVPTIADYAGRLILNLGYLIGGRFNKINEFIISICQRTYRCIGATECTKFDNYFVSPLATQDSNPFGIVLIVMIIATVIVLVKGSKTERIFSGAWLMAFFVTILLNKPFIPSISRYELPVMVLGAIVIGIAVKNVSNKNSSKMMGKKGIAVVIILITISISNIQYCNFKDSEQPIYRNLDAETYDEKKTVLYKIFGWNDNTPDILDYLEENGITDVGIWEETTCGIYPFLMNLKDSKYKVRSLVGKYGANYVEDGFIPQAILYVGDRDRNSEKIEYNETIYKLVYVGSYLHVNESQVYLYEAE